MSLQSQMKVKTFLSAILLRWLVRSQADAIGLLRSPQALPA
jgi:hypothetical protein